EPAQSVGVASTTLFTIKKKTSSSPSPDEGTAGGRQCPTNKKGAFPCCRMGKDAIVAIAPRRAMGGFYSRSLFRLSRLFYGDSFFELSRQQNGLRDLPHGPPGVHALALHDPEGVLFGNLLAPHEEALGPFHQLADFQGFLHLKRLLHQGRVFDGDRRLVSHCLEHLDLLGRKQVLVRR